MVAAAGISLAPLRRGGGTRLKIIESMAIRTPVVATSKAVEGLAVRHGEHLLIADQPMDFARAVVTLLRKDALRKRLAANALQLVQSRYDSRVVMPAFLTLVNGAASAHAMPFAATGEPGRSPSAAPTWRSL
jgi:glycosyltransferase involved in cell wall biosynthesis